MPNKKRLEGLASAVEAYEEFSQASLKHCSVGIAKRLIQQERGSDEFVHIHEVADYLGLSLTETYDVLTADYSRLNIGMEDSLPDMSDVTRETAAKALRQLAARG